MTGGYFASTGYRGITGNTKGDEILEATDIACPFTKNYTEKANQKLKNRNEMRKGKLNCKFQSFNVILFQTTGKINDLKNSPNSFCADSMTSL